MCRLITRHYCPIVLCHTGGLLCLFYFTVLTQSTGGVLDPVVKDTEQPVLQDPTLIQTVRDTGDSDASRSGVPSPPTVTAPDGRDYKAPVEDRKEGETGSDNVELPKVINRNIVTLVSCSSQIKY